ncbi:ATP-binding cassette domain-containing protein [Nocardia vinacea]|uniref:ATP-binding cassette domain-containing protein n=1 Tax=Nocardia vinacea TaxID=96468 RepID=A0ABZ1YY92_9NOCA|nr:ATP-binding cassette domain-containing protein [Nocardia vinacea]
MLDGIDLRLRSGEIVALLWRPDSGKSTLLRITAGLIAPSSGHVRYRGTELNRPGCETTQPSAIKIRPVGSMRCVRRRTSQLPVPEP